MSDGSAQALPDKIYFKIGEVSEIVGVEPYVLRYWETEFPVLRPGKSRAQQRLYRKRDVELLLKIKRLLYDDMYTIAGAKKQLARTGERGDVQMSLELASPKNTEVLQRVEKELNDLLRLVDDKR